MILLVDATRISRDQMVNIANGHEYPEGSLLVPYIPGPLDEFPPIMQVKECDRDVVEKVMGRISEHYGPSKTKFSA